MTNTIKVCPRCNKKYDASQFPPATSRVDDETEVCSDCGESEAFAGIKRGTRLSVYLNSETIRKAKIQAAVENVSISFLMEKVLTIYLSQRQVTNFIAESTKK